MTEIKAVLFDKDGTLFGFEATWAPFTARFLETHVGSAAEDAAAALGFDLKDQRFLPGSPAVAGTVDVWLGVLAPYFEGGAVEVARRLLAETPGAEQVPVAPLRPLLGALREEGLALGVATNDSEVPARAHLVQAGIADLFAFVAGFDSGHGAKPGPGMLQAFARHLDLPPDSVLMVGDSTHDLSAAAAAGMPAVGVLTGTAVDGDLDPLAEAVLPSIADLPAWLTARKAAEMSQMDRPAVDGEG